MHSPNRRELLGLLAAGGATALLPQPAAAAGAFSVQRQLALQMARSYALNGDRKEFRQLFDTQTSFLGLNWPDTSRVIEHSVEALLDVLDGIPVSSAGFRRVVRQSPRPTVVFSDHHILPDAHRQSRVWRANRAGYVRLLEHYGAQGRLVVENGDAEDLVICEPIATAEMYASLRAAHKGRGSRELIGWYQEDPAAMLDALQRGRRVNRKNQLRAILDQPENSAYYAMLERLAASKQLVRLAGNHDYDLQTLDVPQQLIPDDVLLLGRAAILHGHQFNQATHPAVAPLYGEVVSECLGVFYEGPDQSWAPRMARRIRAGGFPNTLSSHQAHTSQGVAGSFLSALLKPDTADDQQWAQAWESLFGHPIAWEYGAADWESAVRGSYARPRDLVDEAMRGRQFFKFRHLDEQMMFQALRLAHADCSVVLGHSHEVRAHPGRRGGPAYYNSGAAGRFEKLIWALEIDDDETIRVVGWFIHDDHLERVDFRREQQGLTSFFVPSPSENRLTLGSS